jgi:hypothetical protein
MIARKGRTMRFWLCSLSILLMVVLLLPGGSVFAQDEGPQKHHKHFTGQTGLTSLRTPSFENAALAASVIQDGSFEAFLPDYDDPYWYQYDSAVGTPLCTEELCGSLADAAPQSGLVWAWFGGTDAPDYYAYVAQDVVFPSCAGPLQFYLWMGYADPGSDVNDVFDVWIDEENVFSADATQINSYSSYQLVSIDVSSFAAGVMHTIWFTMSTSNQIVNVNLDDVSLLPATNCRYTISGNAGIAEATLSYTDGTPKTATADGSGNYSFTVPYAWSGTVTPSKPGYTFTPASLSYYMLNDQTGQNYTASPATYTISGNAEIPGVTLSYTDGSAKTATTDGSGNYSFIVSYNWSGTVTPSHPCYTFSPEFSSYTNVTANKTAQNYTATGNPGAGCTDVVVNIGSTSPVTKTYWIAPHSSTRPSFTGINNGPVQISQTSNDLVASQRVIYSGWSYSEMMGLPAEQLSKEYLFPYYNNVAMDSQLRVSNVGGADTTITVYLAGTQIDQYALAAGGATRKNYTGKNSGPLRVTSSASNILATTRVLYNVNSYSELMGLPIEQLGKEYLFPYYNNVAMNSQLRVSNVGGADTTITVYLGTTQIDSYSLTAGGSTRKNYTGRNSGPLRVTSTDSNILTTIRVLYNNNSYSELMGFPTGQLGQEYWYPVYDNVAVDSQLRVSNVGGADTTITVYLGTTQIDSYTLTAGGATRKNYTGRNTGPLHVVSSSQSILTTIRMLYAGNSYYEMTGLPNSQLSTQYFFPWYNNTAMKSELRVAVP